MNSQPPITNLQFLYPNHKPDASNNMAEKCYFKEQQREIDASLDFIWEIKGFFKFVDYAGFIRYPD